MKNGIELITQERIEQINVNGFDKDIMYQSNELVNAALFLLTDDPGYYPNTWGKEYQAQFANKTPVEKLTVAGALIAAEIDRIQHTASDTEYDAILANAKHNTGRNPIEWEFTAVEDISSFDRAASLSDENWRHENMQTRGGRAKIQSQIDLVGKFIFYYSAGWLRWNAIR